MSYTAENNAECRRILEALTSCVTSTRHTLYYTLDSDVRSERVTQVDSRIRLLSDTFNRLTVDLKRERNSYLPINRIVDDLLICTWTYTQLSDRLAISRVNSRWRRLALSASNLWGMINIDQKNIRCLRNLLERSGLSPLHVVVGSKIFAPIPLPSYMSRPFGNIRCQDDIRPSPRLLHLRSEIARSDEGGTDFIRQCEFDAFVGRCATLDALVDDSRSHYVTPKSALLTMPMVYLRTLRLTQSNMSQGLHHGYSSDLDGLISSNSNPRRNLNPENLPFPLFSNVTPRLRELCFDYVHARWDDPIYRNLTNLRVYKPHERVKLPQILRILRSCPNLTDLELYGCIQALSSSTSSNAANEPLDEPPATMDLGGHSVVSLPKLKYLSLHECHDETTMKFLASLSFPQLKRFYMDNSYDVIPGGATSQRHKPCFTDQLDRPFPSLLPTISKPKLLRINTHSSHIFLHLQYMLNESDRVRLGKWMHHGDDSNSVRGPKMNHPEDYKYTDEESGRWSYQHHPVSPRFNVSESVNANDWTSVAYTIGLQPTPGASPPYPTVFNHRGMQPQLIPITREYIDLFYSLSIAGVQFDMIHTLQLDGSSHFPDLFYRTIFGLCSGIRTLRMNYHKGVGVLAAIVKDDESMLPELESIYLDLQEAYGPTFGMNLAPAEVLANWVETRQRKASTPQALTGSPIRSLKTVHVRFYHPGHPELATTTRDKIESALGENGVFVWRLKETSTSNLRIRQIRALKEDIHVPYYDKVKDHGKREEGDESDSDDDEEDLSGHDCRPVGWSAGPW